MTSSDAQEKTVPVATAAAAAVAEEKTPAADAKRSSDEKRPAISSSVAPATDNKDNTDNKDSSGGFLGSIPTRVIILFVLFSVGLVVVPIGTYFYALNNWYNGNTTPSAIAAVVSTNALVFAYCLVAYYEGPAPPAQLMHSDISMRTSGNVETRKDR